MIWDPPTRGRRAAAARLEALLADAEAGPEDADRVARGLADSLAGYRAAATLRAARVDDGRDALLMTVVVQRCLLRAPFDLVRWLMAQADPGSDAGPRLGRGLDPHQHLYEALEVLERPFGPWLVEGLERWRREARLSAVELWGPALGERRLEYLWPVIDPAYQAEFERLHLPRDEWVQARCRSCDQETGGQVVDHAADRVVVRLASGRRRRFRPQDVWSIEEARVDEDLSDVDLSVLDLGGPEPGGAGATAPWLQLVTPHGKDDTSV